MKRLNGNQLKIIALVTMTIDHVGMYLLPQFVILRIIGRLSMPIFAYMIAEGCRYTKNKRYYLLLTLGVGLICQVVYWIAMQSLYQCILITFSLSILLIYSIDYAVTHKTVLSYLTLIIVSIAIFFVCQILPILLPGTDFSVSYGIYGVLLPVFAFLGKDKLQSLILFAIGLVLMNYALGNIQWYSLITLILLALYNGSRGKYKLKYLFYIYYPTHLAALYGIGLLLGK